jgi:hypothetical protein
MEYEIVYSSSPEGLMKKVRSLMEEGFIPTGGMMSYITKSQNRFRGNQHVDTINSVEYTQMLLKNVRTSN